jgi:hypothetical protein
MDPCSLLLFQIGATLGVWAVFGILLAVRRHER